MDKSEKKIYNQCVHLTFYTCPLIFTQWSLNGGGICELFHCSRHSLCRTYNQLWPWARKTCCLKLDTWRLVRGIEQRNILDQVWYNMRNVRGGDFRVRCLVICWSLKDKSGIGAQHTLGYILCYRGKRISWLRDSNDSVSWRSNSHFRKLTYRPRSTGVFLSRIFCGW